FSALLVWAVAYPVLGLKLTIVGIHLEVHGTSSATLITIAVCSVLMFLRVLFDQQISSAWRSSPNMPLIPAKASNFLTLPTTQRWIIIALISGA
ncbi:high-affinity branched-chain amino acid ABC transporter permease LivM, partial [Pseudomonas sp. GW247-3R2A]